MRCTCKHAARMPKMIQIRNVPDDVHRTLKVRAAEAGMSLSDYLREELIRRASIPTAQELARRVRAREPVELTQSPAEIIREVRGPLK
jgi:plasmid stability protein